MLRAISQSIALKVIVLVGTAMTVMFVIQSYVNISSFQKLVHPLIVRDLDNSLLRSKMVFDNIYQQTIEDARIIRSHNALTNYLDYEQIDDKQGLNDELVQIEQFLSSLTASKPRYREIEIITSNSSIIRLLDGHVIESNNASYTNGFIENSIEIEDLVYFDVFPTKGNGEINNVVRLNLD
jgi:hypothetical protein